MIKIIVYTTVSANDSLNNLIRFAGIPKSKTVHSEISMFNKALMQVCVFLSLTAVLCAEKRNMAIMNRQTPAKEMSCSGRFRVSIASHATSSPSTITMNTLKHTERHNNHDRCI